MATIINNPVDTGEQSTGWAVAVVVLLIVIAGGVYWYMHHYGYSAPVAQPSGGTTLM